MGKAKTPQAPDYMKVAAQQDASNLNAARQTAVLNRPNETNPFGSSTWTRKGSQFTNTTTLDPQTQAMVDSLQSTGAGLANRGTVDLSGARAINPTMNLDTSGLVGTPERLASERQAVSDAMYGNMTRYLDDQFGRGEESLRTRLANQGLSETTEASGNAMRDFYRAKNDSYLNAANQATLAGQNAVTQDIGSLVNALTAQSNIGNTEFNQSLAGNQAEVNNIMTQWNQPIQDYTALTNALQQYLPATARGGNGSAGASVQPADYQGAAQQKYQADLNATNAKNAGNAAIFKALASVALGAVTGGAGAAALGGALSAAT